MNGRLSTVETTYVRSTVPTTAVANLKSHHGARAPVRLHGLRLLDIFLLLAVAIGIGIALALALVLHLVVVLVVDVCSLLVCSLPVDLCVPTTTPWLLARAAAGAQGPP